jgi:thiamine transporter
MWHFCLCLAVKNEMEMNSMEATLSSKIATILAQPTSVFTLAALVVLILAFVYIKKIKLNTSMLAHLGLMLALTVILHTFRLYHMPQGGSVTLGGMIPLFLISFRYGAVVGYLAGFVYGLINLIQDPYILHPVQVLFDYPLPYMAIGLAGYFKERILLGAIVGSCGRFICHFISGAVFFASYAPPGTSPYWYSLVFNATYLVPELIICLFILRVLPVKRILLQMRNGENYLSGYGQ